MLQYPEGRQWKREITVEEGDQRRRAREARAGMREAIGLTQQRKAVVSNKVSNTIISPFRVYPSTTHI
jgi:hypothetical protein